MKSGIRNSDPRPQTLVAVRPEGLPANLLLAKKAIEQGRPDQARALLDETTLGQVRQLVSGDPSRVDVMAMLGLMFVRIRRLDEAEHWFRRLLQQGPDLMALQQVADICCLTGRFSQATDWRRQAMELAPDNVEIRRAYGLDLIREGLLEEGLGILEQVVQSDPDHAEAHAQWLFHKQYLPDLNREDLCEQYRQWGRRHYAMTLARAVHANDPDPERRLRIGYLSPDFRTNSVAYTFEPLLDSHDREQVQVFGYGNVAYPDTVTQRLAAKFDVYHDVCGLDDEAVSQMIERDQIDILVTLAGHVDNHRLGVLARKPAPIQADFQGINTTGMAQVDYRFTDAWLDPPSSERYYVEQSAYLQGGLLCYRPPEWAPPVRPLSLQHNGFVTFGSFNNSMKINPTVISLWAEVLKATAGSRLLLKFAGGDEPRIRERFLRHFERVGLTPDRVRIIGWRSPPEHLESYHQVDVALDTYPFNGCITTLEGLWMGVPTVTLAGDPYVSHVGLDILSQVGLGALVAHCPEEYVAKARGLAHNRPALAKIHTSLRQAMAVSPLCDGKAHAQALEQALRQMWRRWCEDPIRNQKSEIKNSEDAPLPPDPDAMEFFICERSDLKFTISKKGLPAFLFEAALAVEAGDIVKATAVLSDQAMDQVRRIPDDDPARVDAAFMLATLLGRTEQPDKAESWYREVVQRRPHPLVYFELGNLARSRGRLSQALEYQRRAVDMSPHSPELQAMLADRLIKAGRAREGIDILRRVVETTPDRTTHSKYLWHLHQGETLDRAVLFEEHQRWGRLHAPKHLAKASHKNEPNPDRRLRIGYISPDLCGHSVAYFFEALLDGHDPQQVETFGYGNVACQDVVTERLKAKFHQYYNIRSRSDQDVVRLIEEDRIDILVDLAGHTGDNRLAVLACKPAPVQVSFLGYPDTTGMEQIDYRFTDAWADLPDAQPFYTEQLIVLPSGFIAYRPPGFAPEVGPLPAHEKGFVTFGSFNNNGKINAGLLDLWAEVLRSLPDSRLLLKFEGGDDGPVRQHYLDELARRGVNAGRITVVGRRPVLEHFGLYNQVDIALDTFPYHGTTTTCEAMWMGVPTVTLVGNHHASRVGLSLLTRVGLEVFAAGTPGEYVGKAVAFARETDHLVRIRRSLRNMMLASPLCDGKAHARQIEAAYRRIWQRWCTTACGPG